MEVPLLKNTTLQDLIEDIKLGTANDRLNIVLKNEPNIKTQENLTTLAKTGVEVGSKDILVTLLEHGLKVTDVLYIVITSGKEELMGLVLDEVTDKKTQKFILNECVYYAVKANKKDIITSLLKRGANINTNQREKNTPIHTAITEKCEVDILKHLINNEANTKLTNKKNKTALDLVNDLLDNSENDTEEKEKLEKMKNLLIDKDYEVSTGGPSVLSGFSYQIKYLTLYAIINTKLAISQDCQYELSTEAMDLIPFDDIHLRKTQGGRTRCEFVQVKQGRAEQYKFFTMLNNDKNMKDYIKGNDSIVKMFIKFNKIVDNPVYKNTSTKFVYCMNGNFQNESSDCFKQISMVDNDLLCGVKRDHWIIDPKYLFIEIKYVMLNLIATSLYFTIMTDEFKKALNEQIQILDNFIKENLIDIDNEHLWGVKMIAEKGLNGIKEYLAKYETKTNNTKDKKNMGINLSDASKLASRKDLLKKESVMKLDSDKDIFLFLSKYEECEIKNKIDNFVKHFSVYTNCPSGDELDEIIGQEIKGEFKVEIPKLITAFCIKYVSEWISNFKKGKLQLFSDSDGKKLFNNIRIQIFNEFNKTYIEELQRCNIRFEQTNEQVKNFLNSENNQILHIITQNTRLHTINIMQTLETLNYFDNHSIYCENLGRIIKSIDNCKTFFDGFNSNDSNVLLILECSHDSELIQNNILNGLKNITKNARKKLIIIAGNENQIITSIKRMTNGHISCKNTLAFKDLTLESQEMILNKTVYFHNNSNSVKTSLKISDFITISTACEVIDENILSTVVTNTDVIQIGNDNAFTSDEYNSELYIPRRMDSQTELIPQNIKDKIVIVANNAGEGKSTLLTHLAHCMRNKSENSWIIRVDLRNYTDNKIPNNLNSITYTVDDTNKAIEHITRMVLKTNSTDTNNTLERILFREILNKCNTIGIMLFIDGFDEISPSYKEKTCIMLKALAKSDVKQLWVTTRVHLKEYLEKQLEVTAHALSSFTEKEQIQFLCKFWKFHLKNNKCKPEATEEENNLDIFEQQRILMHNFQYIKDHNLLENTDQNDQGIFPSIQNLIADENLLQSLAKGSLKLWEKSMENIDFLKIPLHLEMLANNLMQREWKLVNSKTLQLHEIYTDFIDTKLTIYFERSTTRRGNQHALDQADITTALFRKMHREIAVRTLFESSLGSTGTGPVLPDLSICSEHSNKPEMLIRAGLVKSYGSSVEFVHRTFAEYFFSEYLATHLKHPDVQTTFLKNILNQNDFQLVRKFFNKFLFQGRMLSDNEQGQEIESHRYPYENILIQKAKKAIISYTREKYKKKENENVLRIAVSEGHIEIYLLLFKNISKKAFVNLVMKNNYKGNSILHICILNGHVDMFRTILDSIKDLKIPINLIGQSWKRHTSHTINTSSLSSIVNYAKQRSVLRDRLVYCSVPFGFTILHTSTVFGKGDVFSEIIINAANTCSVLETLITKVDKHGRNALHYAAHNGNSIHIILKSIEENSELCKDLILQADTSGETALHIAIFNNSLEVCELILETAGKYEEVFKDMMMKCDLEGQTALHAAVCGSKNTISILLLKALEKFENSSLNKYLINQRDNRGRSLLDAAEDSGQDEVCDLILKLISSADCENVSDFSTTC